MKLFSRVYGVNHWDILMKAYGYLSKSKWSNQGYIRSHITNDFTKSV
jgi:hypothetical protein